MQMVDRDDDGLGRYRCRGLYPGRRQCLRSTGIELCRSRFDGTRTFERISKTRKGSITRD